MSDPNEPTGFKASTCRFYYGYGCCCCCFFFFVVVAVVVIVVSAAVSDDDDNDPDDDGGLVNRSLEIRVRPWIWVTHIHHSHCTSQLWAINIMNN
jgi:hypothetical protein